MPPIKTHLTAFVMHLPTDEAVGAATEALGSCAPLVASHFSGSPPRVTLRGLGSFGASVLFCQIEAGEERERLAKFVAAISELFRARGLLGGGDAAWQPHVTVLKTSAARRDGSGSSSKSGRKQKLLKIPYALWREREDEELGTHVLPSLQLCAMAGIGNDGYYRVLSELPFG